MSTWSDQNQQFIGMPIDQLIALTAYGEAANQGTEGLIAVMNVVKNRTIDAANYADKEISMLANSIWHGVILKAKQFSAYNLSDPVRATLNKFASNFQSYVSSNPTLANAYQLAQKLLNGELFDNTNGATHYHTTSVLPSWASSIGPVVAQIGDHIFYQASSFTKFIGQYVPPEISENITPIVLVLTGAFLFYMYYKHR